MSEQIEGEDFQPVVRRVSQTKLELRLAPTEREVIPDFYQRLSMRDSYYQEKIKDEIIIDFWDFSTVEEEFETDTEGIQDCV